jgi:hypothetical protein
MASHRHRKVDNRARPNNRGPANDHEHKNSQVPPSLSVLDISTLRAHGHETVRVQRLPESQKKAGLIDRECLVVRRNGDGYVLVRFGNVEAWAYEDDLVPC